MTDTEIKVPLALLAVAVVIFVGYGFYFAGAAGATIVFIGLSIQVVIGVVLGILACLVTAALMNTSFGLLNSACLKLAAVITFPAAVGVVVPVVGWLLALVLYPVLLVVLFDLDLFEVIVFAIVLVLISFCSSFVARILLAGLGG